MEVLKFCFVLTILSVLRIIQEVYSTGALTVYPVNVNNYVTIREDSSSGLLFNVTGLITGTEVPYQTSWFGTLFTTSNGYCSDINGTYTSCKVFINTSATTLSATTTPSYSINFTVWDLTSITNWITVTVKVVAVAKAPSWNSTTYNGTSVPEGAAGSYAGFTATGLCSCTSVCGILTFKISSCTNNQQNKLTFANSTLKYSQYYSLDNGDYPTPVCTITCTDSTSSLSATASLTVYVYDVNNYTPTFYPGALTSASIFSPYPNQVVATIPAFDDDYDKTTNGYITYSVLPVGPYYSYFGFPVGPGLSPDLYVIKYLPFTAGSNFTIVIQAKDNGSPAYSSSYTITVWLNNTSTSSSSSSSTSTSTSQSTSTTTITTSTTTSACFGPSCGNTPAILGGVLGGIGGLALVAGVIFLIYYCVRPGDKSAKTSTSFDSKTHRNAVVNPRWYALQ